VLFADCFSFPLRDDLGLVSVASAAADSIFSPLTTQSSKRMRCSLSGDSHAISPSVSNAVTLPSSDWYLPVFLRLAVNHTIVAVNTREGSATRTDRQQLRRKIVEDLSLMRIERKE
jgi:hypothetical protein